MRLLLKASPEIKLTISKWHLDKDRFSEYADDPTKVWLLRAWVGNEVVGFAEFYEDWGTVENVQVVPEYRRQGIATRLYNAIEKRFGIKLTPSSQIEPDGMAFWKNRNPDQVRRRATADIYTDAQRLDLKDFLDRYVAELLPEHLDSGKLPNCKGPHDWIPVGLLDPSEWEDWDEYDEFGSGPMADPESSRKINQMVKDIRSGQQMPPVLVEGLKDNPRMRPMVVDGHHRTVA